ncbi:MAG: hypothetical protein AB1Z19_06070, partial [Eubacteriales bacterium]
MKHAIVDIGSNTIRMVIYRVFNGKLEYLLNSKIIGRLADYIDDGVMHIDGAKVMIDAINRHKALASHHNIDHINYFATAPLRISNVDDVLAAVREGTGAHIDVLSGEKEARCGVDGISYDLDISNCICLDLGGGSLEISLVKAGQIKDAVSLNIGSVSMTKNFVSGILPTRDEVAQIRSKTLAALEKTDWLCCDKLDVAYAVGGSARAMAKMHQIFNRSEQELHGYRIFSTNIHK